MRRLLLFVLFVSSLRVFAATPIIVTGTMQNPGNVGIQGNSYVMFRLQNFAGFVPRVQGTAIIADTELKCSAPTCLQSNGHFSIPVWSNSDIVPNTCGPSGLATCTYYTIEFWVNGKLKTSGNYCVLNTNPTFDLNSNAPCQVPPLPPAPDTGGGGGGTPIALKTNGSSNPNQSVLNLSQGPNVTLSAGSDGTVTITAAAGGTGDALLHPPTDQTFQAAAPTTSIHFRCPVGAANGFNCYDFLDADGSNLFSIRSGGTFIFKDGISGHLLAQYFGNSTGSLASTGLLRAANTDVMLGWRNNGGTGDVTLSKDNTDTLNWSGVIHMKTGSNFYPFGASMTSGRPMVSSGADTYFTSQAYVDASSPVYADPNGDDCLTLHNALVDAATLGQNVDATGLTGNRACASNPMYDSYNGKILLGPSIWWIQSNAASWTMASRLDIIGVGPGRPQAGPTNGTILQACNEANGSARHSVKCGGATFDPMAGNLCRGGDPVSGTPFACPLIGWSKGSEHFAATQQFFDTHIAHLTISGNAVSGAVGVRNGLDNPSTNCGSGACGAQEADSGLLDVRFDDFGVGAGRMIDFETGSRNSLIQAVSLNNNSIATADCSASIPVIMSTTLSGNGPKGIRTATSTNTACTTKPVTSLQLDASEAIVDGYHCEQISGQCLDVAKNQDVLGVITNNVNGVLNSGTVIHIESGHNVGVSLNSTLNINAGGYTVVDDIHTIGGQSIKIRVPGPEGTNLLDHYGFDAGTTNANPINSSSPYVPKSFDTSARWTTNDVGGFSAWDAVKLSAGTDYVVTGTAIGETNRVLGFTRTAITDPASNVALAAYGIISGPISDTNCSRGDWVIPSTSTAKHVECSTAVPYNVETLGWIIAASTSTNPVTMFAFHMPPRQPIASCTGTNGNPSIACGANNVGTVSCANGTSAATCTVNTTAVHSNSVILVTRSAQLSGSCDVAMTETAASLTPIASISAGTNFVVNVPTLTAAKQFCFNYQIINP